MNKTTPENSSKETYCLIQLEDLLLKMISYEAELRFRAVELEKTIELSLENRNKELFIEATNELNAINDYLNS